VKAVEVCVDARMIAHSGIGTFLRNLLPHLIADPGLRFSLLGDREKLAGYPWFDPGRFVPIVAAIYSLREQAGLRSCIPPCDVFWSPHFNVPLLPIRARRRLATIHDVLHLAHPHLFAWPKRVYSRILFEGAVRLSDAVATVSEFSRSEIESRLSPTPGKLTVIPNGRDPDFAQGLGPAAPAEDYLLFVGNVKPHKNIVGAMRAFMKVGPRYPRLTLRIVGRKDGFITGDAQVAELAAALGGKVVFTGHVSDRELKEYYRDAKALVFPSLYEGFGLPILEAMSFGIPVLSSDRASMPEVGGDAILYRDPEDIDGFARGIEDILEGRWRPDPARYRARLEKFDWGRSAEAYGELIRTVAAKGRG